MNRRNVYKLFFIGVIFMAFSSLMSAQSKRVSVTDQALQTMKKATTYMMDVVSYNGGFVWSYLPDFSRSWGEMEAYRTMAWVQSPGTPEMGHLLLDAYHATGDEFYYEAASKVANALIWGQLPCGGWNYMFDFAGENSLKKWYATIGKSGWRLEEFQHYYGNATFDDKGTMQAAKFLLRMYVEKNDPAYRPALEKAISFVLESQYPIGGWPQRYPLKFDHPFNGKTDYSSFITLNDDVNSTNIEFLLQCYQVLGTQNVKNSIYKAMNLLISLQQGEPYSGWADQYTVDDLQPAHARSYEPRGINSGTTVRAIGLLIEYYKLTGETKFLAGIPSAIDYLESLALPQSEVQKHGRTRLAENTILVPRFVDPEDGTPYYVHRRGSNSYNGQYYVDQDISNTVGHYSSVATVNIANLKKSYEDAKQLSSEQLKSESPLLSSERKPLNKYYSRTFGTANEDQVKEIISSLSPEGCWLSPIGSISNPYKAPVDFTPSNESKYVSTNVGDEYDTSCFRATEPVMGISTSTYINNMMRLIGFITK